MGNCRSGKLSSGKLTFWETVILGNFLLEKILWEISSGNFPTSIQILNKQGRNLGGR